jgi:hypothetical protein
MRERHGYTSPEKMPPEGGAAGTSSLQQYNRNQPMQLSLAAWIFIRGVWNAVDGGQNNQIRDWR